MNYDAYRVTSLAPGRVYTTVQVGRLDQIRVLYLYYNEDRKLKVVFEYTTEKDYDFMNRPQERYAGDMGVVPYSYNNYNSLNLVVNDFGEGDAVINNPRYRDMLQMHWIECEEIDAIMVELIDEINPYEDNCLSDTDYSTFR